MLTLAVIGDSLHKFDCDSAKVNVKMLVHALKGGSTCDVIIYMLRMRYFAQPYVMSSVKLLWGVNMCRQQDGSNILE